ncbi:glycosyltransferase family 2 protein [Pseudoroseicyclus sp. H15]
MQISVIIPSYNRAAQIAGAVLSAAHQTRPPGEIIVVDDGSTDHTRAVVEALALPNLTLISQPNAGGSAARNAGIAAARHPWIAFQDSDDAWLPHKLETIARELARHEAEGAGELNAVFSAFTLYDPARRTARLMPKALARAEAPLVLLRDPLREARLLAANAVSTQTLVARRAVLERLGGFDIALRRFQDWDLAIRLAADGPMLYLPEPLAHVALSPDSLTRNYRAGLEARQHLLRKHAALHARAPGDARRARLDLALHQLALRVKGRGAAPG